MICPHCNTAFHDSWTDHGSHRVTGDPDRLQLETAVCPECERFVVRFRVWRSQGSGGEVNYASPVIYPSRTPPRVPPEVPDPYAKDFTEAALVLVDSPKASAALSRRIVQHVLREKGKYGPGSLNDEIDEAINAGDIPTGLANDLDALRTVGNFAAHPIKSTHTGEVVDVEPGEADWLLGLLEDLFDFFFVRPSRRDAQRVALNEKLREAGKRPLKGSDE